MPSFTFISESLRFSRTDATRIYFDFRRRMRDRQDPEYRENYDYEDYERECYYVSLADHPMANNGRYWVNLPTNSLNLLPIESLEYEIVGAVPGGHPTFRIHYQLRALGEPLPYIEQLRCARMVESHFTMCENHIEQWINMHHMEDFVGNPTGMEVEVEDMRRIYEEEMEVDEEG